MFITEKATGIQCDIRIEILEPEDYKYIAKKKFFFNWNTEKGYLVFKLRLITSTEILGLISLAVIEEEKRIEIRLLAVSKENRGRRKKYEGITGNLLAYACREAVLRFDFQACVSLLPKTKLKAHYKTKYGMLDGGRHVFLQGSHMLDLIRAYEI